MTRCLLRYPMALLASVLMLLFVSGCGSSSSTGATLVAMTISPQPLSNQPDVILTVGQTVQFSATAIYSNGTTADVTSGVTWSLSSSSVPGVATITASGQVTGVAAVGATISVGTTTIPAGTTTISATINGLLPVSTGLAVVAAGPNPFIEDWSTTGSPTGVAVAAFGNFSGNVYVTDSTNNLLRVYDAYGAPITSFSTIGEPHGVAIDSGNNLYVTDISNNMLRKFRFSNYTSTWIQAAAWPATGSASGVAVDSSGNNVYVTDSLNKQVIKFNPYSSPLRVQKLFLSTNWIPAGVAVDIAGNVYVTDITNNQLHVYTSAGIQVTSWTTTGKAYGVAVDLSGNVYVTDYTNKLISKYNSTGIQQLPTKALLWPTPGGLPYEPLGIALDTLGNVYVTDLANNYLHKYQQPL